MSIEQQIASLTTATTDLLNAVNVKKETLDSSVLEAQNYASSASADKDQTAEDRIQTGLDRIATGEDRLATGADRVQTSADRAQTGLDAQATAADRIKTTADAATSTAAAGTATGAAAAAQSYAAEATGAAAAAQSYAVAADASADAANLSAGEAAGSAAQALAIYGTAAAQQSAVIAAQTAASLAEGYAAAASSVAQQDLSGVTAAALHRSPNAVTAMFVYDTSKDSDGGAWTEKCQHTSWYNEEINGKWLGAHASEIDAWYSSVQLGPELVVGGEFDTSAAGWVVTNGTADIVDGAMVFTATQSGTSTVFRRQVPTVAGKRYRASVDFLNDRATGTQFLNVRDVASGTVFQRAPQTTGHHWFSFTAMSGSTWVEFNASSNVQAGDSYTIDNLSIREVLSITARSGDYFQLTTDGKFYRLWKNLLRESEDITKSPWVFYTPSGTGTRVGNTLTFGSAPLDRIVCGSINVTDATYTASVTLSGTGSVRLYMIPPEGSTTGLTTVELTSTPTRYSVTRTFTGSAGGQGSFGIYNNAAGTPSTVVVHAAQVELGDVATQYEAKTFGTQTTEVFRGNKRDFPRLAGIVAEANRVTIYDLTQPGMPMWMHFLRAESATARHALGGGGDHRSVCAINGMMAVADGSAFSSMGLGVIDFPKDRDSVYSPATVWSAQRNHPLAARNTLTDRSGQALPVISSAQVNAVAMTVLPDAPVDPVTGLKVPTIAVATQGGAIVIRHDGSVKVLVTYPNANISFDARDAVVFGMSENNRNYRKSYPPYNTHASFVGGPLALSSSIEVLYHSPLNHHTGKSLALSLERQRKSVVVIRDDDKSNTVGAAAIVSGTHNTGYQFGDSRRTYLSDVEAGSVSGPELVTNGDFSTSDLTGWSPSSLYASTAQVASGRLEVTATVGFGRQMYPFTTVVGRVYKVSGTATKGTGTGARLQVTNVATGLDSSVVNGINGSGLAVVATTAETPATLTNTFVATQTTYWVVAGENSATAGGTNYFDNISVKEVVADRSYKAQGASITGTLTKTAVASAAQLVAYSGFSASNYLREPYSADLDLGNGEWSVGAWVKVPAANATAATIACREHSAGAHIRLGIDATNKLTATAHDGTTTRTVTTSGTYNTDTWVKPEAIYTPDGALAIRVNGVEVAKTTGAPLLTLSNPDAVLTIGNSYALDAPFRGSITLLKLSATVPTAEQSVWMYEQEKQLFRDGAQCCLPDSGTIVGLAYDDATDKWIAVSAANESEWSGLVRTSVTPVPAGSYTKVAAASGVQLLARSTTNPGVDITIPAYGLREELVKRAEAAAQRSKEIVTFDFDAAGGQAEFALPVGYTTKAVYVDGAAKRQGSTKDFTLLFDGFKETVAFAVAPAPAAWVQIHAIKE